MSNGWITASGEQEVCTSNIATPEKIAEITARQSRPDTTVSREVHMPFNGGPARVTEQHNGEYQAYQDRSFKGSIIETAAAEGGHMIVNRAVRGSDQVTLPGGMTSIAADLGFLVRNPNGSYSDAPRKTDLKDPTAGALPGKPDASSVKGEASGSDSDDTFSLSEEGEAAMKTIVESCFQGDAIRGMDEILNHGEVSPNTIGKLASAANMEPHEMAEIVNKAHQGFYDAVAQRIEASGIDGDAFEAFLKSDLQRLGKFTHAARQLVLGNIDEGFEIIDEAKERFLWQADRFMQDDVKAALDEAGYGWESDGKGRVIVVTNDFGKIPFEVAVHQGIIRFI